MKRNILLIIIFILIVVGVIVYLVIEYGLKKWRCVEGRCEKVIGGDFSSLEKCRTQCSVAQQRYKTDQERRLLTKRRERIGKKRKKVSFSDLVQISPK